MAMDDQSEQTVGKMISSQGILHDPDHKHVDSGKPLFRKPDGTSTDDPKEAQVFSSEADAKKIGDNGPENWKPYRLSDFWPC